MTPPFDKDFHQVFGPNVPSNDIKNVNLWPPFNPNVLPSPDGVYIPKETEDKIKKALAEHMGKTPVKADSAKTDWSLLPMEAVEDIVKVLEFGAKKYSANNWRTGTGFSYKRILNSLLRHIFAYMRGEDLDPESGLSHLAHAGCNIIFLLYYNKYKKKYNNDDRFTAE